MNALSISRLSTFAIGLVVSLSSHAGGTALSVSDANLLSGTSPRTINFPVARTGDNSYDLFIDYKTENDTAIAGTHYTGISSGRIKMPAGATTLNIPVTVGAATATDRSFKLKLTSVAGDAAPAAQFVDSPTNVATGDSPLSVAIGDLNGDGKLDLAVANAGDDNVSVLINTTTTNATTPSYAVAANFAVGDGASDVAIGDLNSDGKPDLAVANSTGNSVSVLINTRTDSTPAFAMAVSFSTGDAPSFVAIGDLNGDAKPDLAVAYAGGFDPVFGTPLPGGVSVLRNATTGPNDVFFAEAATFLAGLAPRSVAIGDLDGDSKPDLAVANGDSNNVSVLRNTTEGDTPAFADAANFTVGTTPFAVAIGDLNGDSKPELAVANSGGNNLSVLTNTTSAGTLAYAAAVNFAAAGEPSSIAIGDVNGDGKPDLAVSSQAINKVSVLTNTRTGSTPAFATAVNFTTGSSPNSAVIGDVNGDSKPDLAVANLLGGGVSVLLNTLADSEPEAEAERFATAVNVSTGDARQVAIGDVNGDGKPDLAVANKDSDNVSVFLSTTANGATALTYAAAVPFFTDDFLPRAKPIAVASGDLNGDGRPDLAVINTETSTAAVLLNTTAKGASTPTYATPVSFNTGLDSVSIVIGDLNGDGKPDLVTTSTFPGSVSVLLNTTGKGAAKPTFRSQQEFTLPNSSSPTAAAIGDLNGDGKPDLAVANSSNDVLMMFNTSTALNTVSFSDAVDVAVGSSQQSVAIGDVNGDNKADIVVTRSGDSVTVLRNTTTSPSAVGFASAVNFTAGSNPASVAIADFDGDGKPDLAVANAGGGNVSVLLNNRTDTTPSFATAVNFSTGNSPSSVTVGDVNGDGKPDLAVANQGSSNVSVLRNTIVGQKNATLTRDTATGTILTAPGAAATDTALPNINFEVSQQSVSEDEGEVITIKALISSAPTKRFTVPLKLSGTAKEGRTKDYQLSSNILSFEAGSDEAILTLRVNNNEVNESHRTLVLTLNPNKKQAEVGNIPAHTVTIEDDDAPPVASIKFVDFTPSVVAEGKPIKMEVTLDANHKTGVDILVHVSGTATLITSENKTGDYKLAPTIKTGSIVFKPGQRKVALTFATVKDKVNDPGETVTVTLDFPLAATLGTASATATIK